MTVASTAVVDEDIPSGIRLDGDSRLVIPVVKQKLSYRDLIGVLAGTDRKPQPNFLLRLDDKALRLSKERLPTSIPEMTHVAAEAIDLSVLEEVGIDDGLASSQVEPPLDEEGPSGSFLDEEGSRSSHGHGTYVFQVEESPGPSGSL